MEKKVFNTRYNYDWKDHPAKKYSQQSDVRDGQAYTVRQILLQYAATGQVTTHPVEYSLNDNDYGNPVHEDLAVQEQINKAVMDRAAQIMKDEQASRAAAQTSESKDIPDSNTVEGT